MPIDPTLEPYVAEARSVNEVVKAVIPSLVLRSLPEIEAARAAMDDPEGPMASMRKPAVLPVEERTIPGPAGAVPVRIFRPERTEGVYLHLHGGGWTMGSAAMMDGDNSELAEAEGLAVVSVDYRLAPEHPYPAGVDDCDAVAAWLLDHVASEFGTERLLIGGESAGASLAALTLLRIRDRRGTVAPIAGANLVYGCYDFSMTPSQRRSQGAPVIDREYLEVSRPHIFGDRPREELRDPAISALYADLTGFPPTLLTVGTLDPFLDDSAFLAARLDLAGVDVRLDVYPESPHGFTSFPTEMAAEARRRMQAFLAGRAQS